MAFTKILGPGIATDTNVQVGILTASKFYGDGSALSNVISGVGINSAGSVIGTGVTILNFIGAGNTFSYNPATQTVNVSIAGGGAIVAKQSFTVGAGGQSIFTLTNNYDTGMIDVYVNGIRLPAADFIETSSNVVTLSYAAEQGDAVEFIAYSQRVQNTVLESTITNLRVTGVSSVGTGITMYGSSGIISATKYYGDGSGLTNVAGSGGGSIGIQSGGVRVAAGITDINIAIGSTTSRVITSTGSTATITVGLGDYYIFRKPEVGFATMRILVAGSNGGIAYSDFYGGSSYSGLSTSNTDQFPWVAGIGVTINPDGKLIFTVP